MKVLTQDKIPNVTVLYFNVHRMRKVVGGGRERERKIKTKAKTKTDMELGRGSTQKKTEKVS